MRVMRGPVPHSPQRSIDAEEPKGHQERDAIEK
jgi:hypothetical protein